jgi:NADPH:quinone reductase-like Zn-dependent oxidoreductase
MHAIRFSTFGDPSVLHLAEVDRPAAGAGEVLVKVAGTSFNPVDAAFRAGYLQQDMPLTLPHTPGLDLAGTVVEGSGFAAGDAVIGFLPMTAAGSAAEFTVAPAEVLTAAPTSIPLADAAVVPAVALTAWQGLFEHAELQAGQRILINGAGGGVGGFAVQFARQAGATVIATASPRSAAAVRAAGAEQIVDYTSTTVTDAVRAPVDAVFNLVRTDEAATAALLALIRPGGVLVSTTGPAPEDTERKVRGRNMYVRSDATQLAEIVRRIDAGAVTVDISARYPLAELAKVHELSATGALRGKVVITV